GSRRDPPPSGARRAGCGRVFASRPPEPKIRTPGPHFQAHPAGQMPLAATAKRWFPLRPPPVRRSDPMPRRLLVFLVITALSSLSCSDDEAGPGAGGAPGGAGGAGGVGGTAGDGGDGGGGV